MNNSYKRLLAEAITGLILSLILAGIIFFQLQDIRKQLEKISKKADAARAGDLARQSQLLDMNDGTKMIQSGLLAVEAARYGASLQADQALRRYLELAALPIAKVSHRDAAYVAYSPNGEYIVSNSTGDIKVWDSKNGRILTSISSRSHNPVIFSPDGKYVASGENNGNARVWEANGGREVISQPTGQWEVFMAFSPDSKLIAWSGKNSIHVWNIKDKKESLNINYEGIVNCLAFSPNGKYILSGGNDSSVRIWGVQGGQEIMKLNHYGEVKKAVFSADGKYIVAASEDGIQAWNANSGSVVSEKYGSNNITDVSVSPDGSFIATGDKDGTVRVWNTPHGSEVAKVNHGSSINSVTFSPNGKFIASTSYDGVARIWVAVTGREVARLDDAQIGSIAFSPDGKYVVAGGCESLTDYQQGQPSICQGVARVWAVSNGRQVVDIPQGNSQNSYGNVNSIMYSPLNDNYVLTGNSDGSARVWDIQSGHEIIRITPNKEDDSVTAIFSPDGKYILTRSWGYVMWVWDARDGHEIAYMPDDEQVIAFSSDGKYVATGDRYGMTTIWETKSRRKISRLPLSRGTENVAFSPNGKYFAASLQGTAQIWEVSNGYETAHITYPFRIRIDRIAFSADSKYIALSSSTDPLKPDVKGIVSIRETSSGREVANYSHPYLVYSDMIFTSDGRYLLTKSIDGTIVMWDMQTGKESARILSGNTSWRYNSLSLSPDNRYLLAGDDSLQIWDLQSDRPQIEVRSELTDNGTFVTRSRYLQSKNEISEIAFSDAYLLKFGPNGRYIIATGSDFEHYGVSGEQHIFISYWRIEDLVAEACRRLPRNFTQAEWVQYFPDEEYRATCLNLPIEPEIIP
ncbi:MAG: hypothetical protein HY865_18945 [Chloroflexi bacterium]|nr:hypothetical protein [Chloroflexota bacterium]